MKTLQLPESVKAKLQEIGTEKPEVKTEPKRESNKKHYGKNPMYSFQGTFSKGPNQMRVIHENALKNEWISEADLMDRVMDWEVQGILKTKQDPWRIFEYYRPRLIALGLLVYQNRDKIVESI